mgnify:CR=1 FL=1
MTKSSALAFGGNVINVSNDNLNILKFEEMCEETHGKGEVCMNDVVYDHMMDWCHSMKRKIEYMEKDWGEPKRK